MIRSDSLRLYFSAPAASLMSCDLREEKSDVLHAIYERITVAGSRIVGARLTQSAYQHGLALALPENVRARPTGVGRVITTYSMPIEDRDEWLAAARRAGVRDGYLRGSLPRTRTARQVEVLAAVVAAGGSVADAAARVGIRPSTAKRHLADLRARSGLSTEQLIYIGAVAGWLVVPDVA